MAYTQIDIDTLKRNIARGVKKMRLGGEEAEFMTLAEMRSVLREMEDELAGIAPGQIGVSYPRTSRGL